MKQDQRGALLVFGSALTWSFGGAIARWLDVADPWAVVCWRSCFAALFLLGFMVMREGVSGTHRMFASMGWAGVAVGACFATASSSFVVALGHTSVANILLMQAGAPLIAALVCWLLFGEKVSAATWVAIVAVIAGVAVMVSASFTGKVSPLGDALALLVALAFSGATILTRRYAHVRMMPAVCLGTLMAATVGALLAGSFAISLRDAGLLFVFGALNLGLGMAFFVTGVRLLPSTVAALIGTTEPVLGPLWVWLAHGEVPGAPTLVGGGIVIGALLLHLMWEYRQQKQQAQPAMPLAD